MRLRQSRALRQAEAEADQQPETNLYYYDRELKSQAIKILPGEYLATARDVVMVTLLGSCVSACLHDPVTGIGGMNHFMLPEGGAASVVSAPARYGVYAMEVLLNDILQQGGRRNRLQAKVFGGGNVLKGFGTNNVGRMNALFVKEYLQREGIPILSEDLLGLYPRKVVYYPKFGRALVRQLTEVPEVDKMEALYRDKLREEPVTEGEVEVFG